MQRSKKIISVDGVTKRYGEFVALHDISFDLYQGDILAIIGPNGSGKSTLVKVLLGIERASEGSVIIHTKKGLRSIGYVAQSFSFDRTIPITIYEFMSLDVCRTDEHKAHRMIIDSLSSVGMGGREDRLLGTLSGGQLQRVLIARALLHKREVIILDEPDANVDIEGEEAIYSLIKTLNEAHSVSFIIVSHELDFVDRFANKVLCLNTDMICHGVPRDVLTPQTMNDLFTKRHKH